MVSVKPGQAAQVVAAYARAVRQAERERALLVAAGMESGGLSVVYLTALTDTARARWERIACGGAGPPPQAGPGVLDTTATTGTTQTTGTEDRAS